MHSKLVIPTDQVAMPSELILEKTSIETQPISFADVHPLAPVSSFSRAASRVAAQGYGLEVDRHICPD